MKSYCIRRQHEGERKFIIKFHIAIWPLLEPRDIFFFVSNGDASNGKTVDFTLVGVYSEVKLCLFVAQGVGRS